MSLQLVADAYGDSRNAKYLATASSLAYLDATQGPPAFKERLGLEAELISESNTQVYVGHNDEHIVVAFRGSESPTSIDGLKDWLVTNAFNYLVAPVGDSGTDFSDCGVGARLHKGFADALQTVWPKLHEKASAIYEGERYVWVTGHSLGGALALLGGYRLDRNFVGVHQVYTFGAPMVGNKMLAESIQSAMDNKIYRYVDDRDFVPKLPTMSLISNEYQHCLKEVVLSPGGTVTSALQSLQTLGQGVVDGVLTADLHDKVWNKCQEMLEAHLLPNYLSMIEKHEKG